MARAIEAGIVAFLIAYLVLSLLIRTTGLNDNTPPLPQELVPYRTAALVLNVAGALAIGALAARRSLRRQHGIAPDRCRHCGCDLTGDTSGICPECGTPLE